MRGIPLSHVSLLFAYPIGSMYVIFSYMYLKISQMYVNIPYMDTMRIFLFQNCHLVYELHLCFSKASFYVYLTAHIWFDFQCVTPFYPIICVPSNEARKNAKKHPTFFFCLRMLVSRPWAVKALDICFKHLGVSKKTRETARWWFEIP